MHLLTINHRRILLTATVADGAAASGARVLSIGAAWRTPARATS